MVCLNLKVYFKVLTEEEVSSNFVLRCSHQSALRYSKREIVNNIVVHVMSCENIFAKISSLI
jgi:hypothetical protein